MSEKLKCVRKVNSVFLVPSCVQSKVSNQSTQYQPGYHVWLATWDLWQPHACKRLTPRYIGPFKILRKINEVTYRLHQKVHQFTNSISQNALQPPNMATQDINSHNILLHSQSPHFWWCTTWMQFHYSLIDTLYKRLSVLVTLQSIHSIPLCLRHY